MKSRIQLFLLSILGMTLLASCQPSYYYHFPKESEVRGIPADSLKWKYSGSTIVQIPVADDHGDLYHLDVTDKTKVLIKSILGDEYRFYLRSIVVDNSSEALFGPNGSWTGIDLHDRVHRTVLTREIGSLTVIAEAPAANRLTH